MIRKPVVAGQFYPQQKKQLEEMIVRLVTGVSSQATPKNRIKAIVLPHAGYQYSGGVAAATVSVSELQETLIILGPNHTGQGESFSVMTEGCWQTPLGDVPIDTKLAKALVAQSAYLKSDALAHDAEHSIEVLLPFLQFFQKKIKIVPIVVSRASSDIYKTIAQDIARVILALGINNDVSIVASSDMTHYEPQESAEKKDHYAIEPILQLDADNLLKRVEEKHITMCGVVAVVIMLEVAKELGAQKGELVRYQTSGDATGDYRSVVGYAGIKIT